MKKYRLRDVMKNSTQTTSLIASEDQEQMALIQWANMHPICKDYLIAIPNGGSRRKKLVKTKSGTKLISPEGIRLKKMGVRAGVSDLFLPYPHNGYPGLWIEMKKRDPKCKASDEQKEWIIKMKLVGYPIFVCWGWDEAKDIILEYLK